MKREKICVSDLINSGKHKRKKKRLYDHTKCGEGRMSRKWMGK